MEKQLLVVIMCAGEGSRVDIKNPKELCEVDGKPILSRVINEVSELNPRKIIVIVGKHEYTIKQTITPFVNIKEIEFINQGQPLGTGHAIITAHNKLKKFNHANVLVIPGDIPFLSKDLLRDMVNNVRYAKIVISRMDNKKDYDSVNLIKNEFKGITHYFDRVTNVSNKKTQFFDTGIYVIDVLLLCKYVFDIDYDNKPKEYILNDIFSVINKNENVPIDIYKVKEIEQINVRGIKTMKTLDDITYYIKELQS
tara:strand:+ start:6890 stop:7648 length:759 start_codon:yes stop_codon:yes gene_type:complete